MPPPPLSRQIYHFQIIFPVLLKLLIEEIKRISFIVNSEYTVTINIFQKCLANGTEGANRTGMGAIFYLIPCTVPAQIKGAASIWKIFLALPMAFYQFLSILSILDCTKKSILCTYFWDFLGADIIQERSLLWRVRYTRKKFRFDETSSKKCLIITNRYGCWI